MKVICAGYPKTGTKSLARALRILGYTVYDYEESIEFAFDEWEEIFTDQSVDIDAVIDKVYSHNVDAVVDLPHSLFFEYFHKRWPGAKVILMVRDELDAYKSFKNMLEEVPKKHPILCHIVPLVSWTSRRIQNWHEGLLRLAMGSAAPNELKWKLAYRRHNALVKSTIPPDQLLVYTISQGWEPICAFLNKEIPEEQFPFENRAGSKRAITEIFINETRPMKRAKMEVAIVFCAVPIVCVILIYYWCFHM